jgi:hypothetical protein
MVEIVHPLKLDKTNCGKEIIGLETHADLELDLSAFAPPVEEKKEIKKIKEEKIPPREFTMEEKIIKEALMKFPLVDERTTELPYLHAKDAIEFVR